MQFKKKEKTNIQHSKNAIPSQSNTNKTILKTEVITYNKRFTFAATKYQDWNDNLRMGTPSAYNF